MAWTLKSNTAVERRLETLRNSEVVINVSNHEGRKAIGYCYIDYVSPERVIEENE